MSRVTAVLIIWALLGHAAAAAEKPLRSDVWPGPAPGEKGEAGEEKTSAPEGPRPVTRVTNVSRPTLAVYKPDKEKDCGAAVVICPGGGYNILAIDLEGEEVARWLNSIGVTGIVLKYRVPAPKGQPRHQAPLQDAQCAMSLVRAAPRSGVWMRVVLASWGSPPAGIWRRRLPPTMTAVPTRRSTRWTKRAAAPISPCSCIRPI